MACDLCGKPVSNLTPLRDMYQTATVKALCDGCVKRVDAELWRIRARQADELKAYITRESQRPRIGKMWRALLAMEEMVRGGRA